MVPLAACNQTGDAEVFESDVGSPVSVPYADHASSPQRLGALSLGSSKTVRKTAISLTQSSSGSLSDIDSQASLAHELASLTDDANHTTCLDTFRSSAR